MAVSYIPEGFHTVTPYLVVRNVSGLITFVERAFGAELLMRHEAPDGGVMHCEFRIGDSIVEAGEASPEWPERPASLHLYVPDADAAYQAAIDAGGESIHPPQDMFYGERSGAVRDPSGNQWFIATRTEDLSAEELDRRAAEHAKKQA